MKYCFRLLSFKSVYNNYETQFYCVLTSEKKILHDFLDDIVFYKRLLHYNINVSAIQKPQQERKMMSVIIVCVLCTCSSIQKEISFSPNHLCFQLLSVPLFESEPNIFISFGSGLTLSAACISVIPPAVVVFEHSSFHLQQTCPQHVYLGFFLVLLSTFIFVF